MLSSDYSTLKNSFDQSIFQIYKSVYQTILQNTMRRHFSQINEMQKLKLPQIQSRFLKPKLLEPQLPKNVTQSLSPKKLKMQSVQFGRKVITIKSDKAKRLKVSNSETHGYLLDQYPLLTKSNSRERLLPDQRNSVQMDQISHKRSLQKIKFKKYPEKQFKTENSKRYYSKLKQKLSQNILTPQLMSDSESEIDFQKLSSRIFIPIPVKNQKQNVRRWEIKKQVLIPIDPKSPFLD